jgi:vanillate/3-O-methylgallate O-demethylase
MTDQSNVQSKVDPTKEGATLLLTMGDLTPAYEFTGLRSETAAYRTSAWIGTPLFMTPIYDVVGPDACKFLESICVNDFSKLKFKGLRHAVICNERGQELTDGVVIRLTEDRYRTYWLNPPIQYYMEKTDLDVHGEVMTGAEYFIQIEGEKSLEILENAFRQDLHDIKFAKRREIDCDGHHVNVIRLGMSGNLAYEIHGPMEEYYDVYDMVWAAGEKFGARKLGMHAYSEYNHTEGGFPNIHQHYILPWFETEDGLSQFCNEHPDLAYFQMNRRLEGSSTDIEERFVNPYEIGCGMLVKFTHDFQGREALEKIAEHPTRTCVTLEWNAEDVGKVAATQYARGQQPADDITEPCDLNMIRNAATGSFVYRADEVYTTDGKTKLGIATGRIRSYNYNAMISLAFINPDYAKEGDEVKVLWGTPGTPQMWIRAKIAHFPYNIDMVRNEARDVEDIPHYQG